MFRKLLLSSLAVLTLAAPAAAGSTLTFGFTTGGGHGPWYHPRHHPRHDHPFGWDPHRYPHHPHPHYPYPTVVVPERPYRLNLECEVTARRSPRDIWISNPYRFATEPGLTVAYSAPGGGSGRVVLPGLAPGQGVIVSNALRTGLPHGTACSAVER